MVLIRFNAAVEELWKYPDMGGNDQSKQDNDYKKEVSLLHALSTL